MSSADTRENQKNCLLVFRNKKVNAFEDSSVVIASFASFGCYFDKISYVAYDSGEEIVRALKDGRENYENLVLYCPAVMENTLKSFVSSLYGATFDVLGMLHSGNDSVFMLYSDSANRLLYTDIGEVFRKKYGLARESAFVRTVGAPAEKINAAVAAAKQICADLCINVGGRFGDCRIEILCNGNTQKVAFDRAYRAALENLNDYVYAVEDIALAERLVQLLKLRRMTICVAESFTGGGICKRLVEIPGVSEVFYEGLNTYSNQAKRDRLGVSAQTLQAYGAVSEQTAYEMVDGLLQSGNCDIAVATTGIAGPKSDNTLKPVGLIYIAVGLRDGGVSVYRYDLKGTRENITETAINLALFLAFKTLK